MYLRIGRSDDLATENICDNKKEIIHRRVLNM